MEHRRTEEESVLLKNFIELTDPDLIFLSEPQIFSSDLPYCMSMFQGDYCSDLNSGEKSAPDLSLVKGRAFGLILWKQSIDKYISVYPSASSSFLPVIFNPPGCPVSVHIAIYMPTSGRETDFLEQLILLSSCLDELNDKYGDCLIFIQ